MIPGEELRPGAPDAGRLPCPGCGGRNEPGVLECDWCGRPFVSPSRRDVLSAWVLLATILILVVMAVVGALVLLLRPSAASSGARPDAVGASPASTAPVLAAPSPRAALDEPIRPPSVPSIQDPLPASVVGAPTPGALTARVVNTAGVGVTVRGEPSADGRSVGTLREGARVALTGGRQTADGRQWMEVEMGLGRVGWVSAEFLEADGL